MFISRLFRKIFSHRHKRYWFFSSLLVVIILLFSKSCNHRSSDENFRIGQPPRWEHLQLKANERNFAAFNNELLAAIAKQQEIIIHVSIYQHLMNELEEGKLDGILTTLEPNYANETTFVFSEPYFLTGPVLIIPLTAPLEGWNEYSRKIIGISSLTPHLLHLEEDPTIQLKEYNDILSALSDLREHKIDGAIFPVIPAYVYATTFYKNELKIATLPLTSEGVRLVALKNQKGEELIHRFNEGFEEVKKNGTYRFLLKQWSLVDTQELLSPNEE